MVVTQLLPAAPADAAQDPTATLFVLFGAQVVVVQLLPPLPAEALQT